MDQQNEELREKIDRLEVRMGEHIETSLSKIRLEMQNGSLIQEEKAKGGLCNGAGSGSTGSHSAWLTECP